MKQFSFWLLAMVASLAAAAATTPATAETPPGLAALTQLEDAFTNVAEKAFPAVVVITNKRTVQRPVYPPNMLPPEFRFFFGLPDEQDQEAAPAPDMHRPPMPAGRGSGVILREDGYILTNYHVIEDADAIEVKLRDGQVFDNAQDKNAVVIVGSDRETDLAVLRIGNGKLKDLPTLPFADSAKVKVGQFAIAVGAPFNFDYSVSIGHVSQKGRYDMHMNRYENYIQTDASINPGNSGGPLLNLRGEVSGINEFIVTGSGLSRGSVGIGFAISSTLAKQVADNLVQNKGVMIRPWLGMAMQPLSEELKKSFKVKSGVLVNDVFKGDPADKAGLRSGDIIRKVGDTEVNDPHDVQFAVLGYKPGEKIPLVIDRAGTVMTLEVTVRQKGSTDLARGEPEEGGGSLLGKIGMTLEESKDGIKVTAVAPGSAAAAAQLRRDDVILEVNRHPVDKVADVEGALRQTANGVAVFYVSRHGAKFFVPLGIGDEEGKE